LRPDRLTFSGTSFAIKKLNWLHDLETGHYRFIASIYAAVTKR
jgi:hypothetical protein